MVGQWLLRSATDLAVEASAASGEFVDGKPDREAAAFTDAAKALPTLVAPDAIDAVGLDSGLREMARAYQAQKANPPAGGALGQLPATASEADAASKIRKPLTRRNTPDEPRLRFAAGKSRR